MLGKLIFIVIITALIILNENFEKKTFRESNNYFYGIGLVIKHYELDIQRSKQSQ